MFRGRANVVEMILSTQACRAQWIEKCWTKRNFWENDIEIWPTCGGADIRVERVSEMPTEMTTWQNLNYVSWYATTTNHSHAYDVASSIQVNEKWISLFATCAEKLDVFIFEVKRWLRNRNDTAVTTSHWLLVDFRKRKQRIIELNFFI